MGSGLNQVGMQQQATSQYYQPFYDDMAQRAQALSTLPFQSYGSAPGSNGYTQQAAQGFADFQPAWQLGRGSDMLNDAFGGLSSLGNYSAGSIYSPYNAQAVQMFNKPNDVGIYSAPNQLQMYGAPSPLQMFAAPDKVANTYNPESFTAAGTSEKYMDPYMQGVVDIAKREADRTFAQQQQQRDATAAQQGAFGGSRAGLVNQAAQRDQDQLLNDIQTKGLDSAWQQAMAQFNAEQQAKATAAGMGLDASKFNSGQQLQYGLAGLNAQQFDKSMQQKYGEDWLGMQQNNIANAMKYGEDVLGKDIFNTNTAMDYGKTGLQNSQFNEQQRQQEGAMQLQAMISQEAAKLGAYNANVGRYTGMGGMGSAMGNIGATVGNQQLSALGGLASAGNSLWNQDFQADNANYNRFMQAQMWPMQQLQFEKGIMSGLPGPTLTSTQYGGLGANPYSQGLGSLIALGGMLG
jgi:hypothetical protein